MGVDRHYRMRLDPPEARTELAKLFPGHAEFIGVWVRHWLEPDVLEWSKAMPGVRFCLWWEDDHDRERLDAVVDALGYPALPCDPEVPRRFVPAHRAEYVDGAEDAAGRWDRTCEGLFESKWWRR
ncbi:MAG: hypothetical protein GY911_11825 [Actinomycetales bacterium]|nr:hypothetical protein [Actinomycetales bacterium]